MTDPIEELYKRHIPVFIGNYSPFRLVLRDEDRWAPTLDEINTNTYDYVKLCRMSTFIDIGIAPFSLGVSFDGSLILPASPDFKTPQQALNKFNETLGIMLLGGLYSESVQPSDVSFGRLHFDGYLKQNGGGVGRSSNFHLAMKTRHLGAHDTIKLLEPTSIRTKTMQTAYTKGKEIFSSLENLSPSLYLNGTSNYVKQQWTEALLFLWTSLEQVINIMWENKIIKEVQSQTENTIQGRTKFLNDFRTWTSSTRIELLYQKGFIQTKDYQLLNVARKTRNDFIHNGKAVIESTVLSAIEALFRLMSLVATDYQSASILDETIALVLSNGRAEFYPKKTVYKPEDLKYYLKLPPIPGDKDWGDKTYEIIEELILQPLATKQNERN
jgi:hypothetical protein